MKELLQLFNRNEQLIIFDIGGCEGEDSIKYAKLFPNAAIAVFEPLPDNQELIKQNISAFKLNQITLYTQALSDTEGTEDFYVSSGQPNPDTDTEDWDYGNKSSSLYPPSPSMQIFPWLEFNTVISVETTTLNSFARNTNLSTIDFIHMDVQGSEMKVLSGAQDFLKKIKAIWLEVSDLPIYQNQPLRTDIEKFMSKNNFEMIKSELRGEFGDQLYINKAFFRTINFFSFKRIIRLKN